MNSRAAAPVKFLLVDDLDENLIALEAILARDGLTLLKAASGTEALELLLDSHAAILLIDSERYLKEGLTYVRSVLDQFRAEIRRIVNELSALGKAPDFPEQWLIAFSKADLLP